MEQTQHRCYLERELSTLQKLNENKSFCQLSSSKHNVLSNNFSEITATNFLNWLLKIKNQIAQSTLFCCNSLLYLRWTLRSS